MDHAGPICRTVEDAEIVYDTLRGVARSASKAAVSPKGLTFGVLRGYFTALLDPQVSRAFENLCVRLRDAGVSLDDVDVPHASDIAPIYLHIVLSEAAALHARTLESRPDDYTPPVRLRLEMGRYVLGEDYARALRGREVFARRSRRPARQTRWTAPAVARRARDKDRARPPCESAQRRNPCAISRCGSRSSSM
jgi:aspartyl-tRNA(Asn)/glutamyl-tRNA(Gln) amidotransferase subunit A